jgi:hypothetical protein
METIPTMREFADRYDLTRCWLWCSTCECEHDAWLWREGGSFGRPAMRWIEPHAASPELEEVAHG